LLDTHALLWWLFDDPRLSPAAREAIKDLNNTVFASSASAWEIATKHRLGKLPEATNAVRRLPVLLKKCRIEPMAISVEHALAAGRLPGHHKDPFDRMIIAQARLEDLPVVTVDPIFRSYRVKVFW
jgi:PIN domain nuclease of toxin-antitoxin system